jgi:putative tryptophan/tyrosine transport system substrate-binding protein
VKRRAFIALVGGAVIARSPVAAAQSLEKVYRIAVFATMTPATDVAGLDPINPPFRAFARTMRDLGYVEGQNLVLERWEQRPVGRCSVIAADLVRRKIDMIVTVGNAMVLEMKSVTNAVPIVMATSSDPVQAGIVASLARPGGNITGFTSDTGPEFEVKRLQLLKEALPEMTRVAYLGLKSDWESLEGRSIRAAASMLGVALVHAEQSSSNYFDAFALITRERPHALFVATNPMNYANRQLIAEFAFEQQMPGVYPLREFVEAGGLMSYGVNLGDLFSRAAGYVDKILKGAKPADLPVQQPTKFEMMINLKTAKALGLTIPQSILLRADEVIQ